MRRCWKIATAAVAVVSLALCALIVTRGLGLADDLDFGAGAYYYADIPDFDKYMHDSAFTPSLPLWVYVLLFLCWGYLMWRLWVYVERRGRNR